MKIRTRILSTGAAIAALLAAAAPAMAAPGTPTEVFDIFWRTFAENYPFSARHGVHWDRVYAEYRPTATATRHLRS